MQYNLIRKGDEFYCSSPVFARKFDYANLMTDQVTIPVCPYQYLPDLCRMSKKN